MSDRHSSKSNARLFQQSPWLAAAVVFLSLFLMALSVLPYLAHLVTMRPWGDFGFPWGGGSAKIIAIDDVTPGGAAARAGLKPGDLIDMRATPLRYHRDIYWAQSYTPGEVLELHVVRGEKPFVVRLVSQPWRPHRGELVSAWLPSLRIVVLISSGLLLILLRPCRMTWGFYIFSLSFLGWRGTEVYLPWDWAIAWRIFGDFLNQAGIVGFLVFALRFPRDVARGWKARIDASAPYLYVGAGMLGALSSNPFGPFVNPALYATFGELSIISIYIIVVLAAGALLDTFVRSSGEDRQRLRWVIAGCILGFSSYPWKLFLPFDMPGWAFNLVKDILPMLIPLSILYGVLKYRVIDLRFVAARSLMYVILIGGFVWLLGSADWLGVRFLSGTRWQSVVLVVCATVFGLAVGPLARLVRNLVDRAYFRAHFDARERLAANADAVRRASSLDEVASLLTSGVAHALGLTSAAAFWPQGDGGLTRGVSCGWPSGSDWHILPGDPAAKELEAKSAVRLGSRSALPGFVAPEGAASPVLALPVRSNGKLHACFVYGAHVDGADLNPEEIAELRWLATEAAMTWRSIASRDAELYGQPSTREPLVNHQLSPARP